MPKYIAVAFADFLLCLFSLFAAFYILSNDDVAKAKANIEDRSFFVAEIQWSKDSASDVDIVLVDPYGNKIYFARKKVESINLDLDDLGRSPVDFVRREVISSKQMVAGKYVVNAFLYRRDGNEQSVKVKGVVTKLAPFSVIAEKEFVLMDTGDEITIASFEIDANGQVFNVDKVSQVGVVR